MKHKDNPVRVDGSLVFKLRIKQGRLAVVADSWSHAERQADAFERDAQRYWARRQAEVEPGLYALGTAAKRMLGVEIYEVPSRA